MGIMARKHLTNTELAIAFCREQEDLFAEYLGIVHNIEPTESGYVLDRAEKEGRGEAPVHRSGCAAALRQLSLSFCCEGK